MQPVSVVLAIITQVDGTPGKSSPRDEGKSPRISSKSMNRAMSNPKEQPECKTVFIGNSQANKAKSDAVKEAKQVLKDAKEKDG